MSSYMYNTISRQFGQLVLCIPCLWIVLALGAEQNAAVVKRDTTFGHVKAMYNRFVSESTGKAKYSDAGKNACSMDVTPSITKTPGLLLVAASKDDFQSSLGCGACIKIIGSGKPAAADLAGSPPVQGELKGIIVDQDDSLNQGDLALLPPQSGSGLWEIKFKATDCPTSLGPTGYIQFRFTGSNEMYFKIQAMNAKVPVAGIEAFERVKGKWFCLTRTPNNFFTSEGMGAVSFPLKVRLTSIMNEQLEGTIDALKNDVGINSDIQFSDSGVRGGSPEGIQCYGQGERPPSGDGDEGFCVSKEDGIFADPADETAFYMCEGEKATKKFCPTGLKFNPVISGCDSPQDVKYVGNEADSSAMLNPKENTMWTSLPGTEGAGHQVPQKDESKTVLNTLPHKVFSINIFNGVHSPVANKLQQGVSNNGAVNSVGIKGKVQDNVTTMGSSLPKENFRKFESAPAASSGVQNEKLSNNPSMFVAQKTQSVDNKYLNNAADQLEGNHHGEGPTIAQEYSSTATVLNTKTPLRPESAAASDNRKFQSYQDVKNAYFLQGHIPTSPHKIFKINIYGSHPQAQNTENEIHTSEQNGLIGNEKIEDVNQHRNTNVLNNGQSAVLYETPGNDYRPENQPHTDLSGNTVQEDLLTPNNYTSMPLHFKLKINMDNSGRQPVINCTLSQCPENDLAIENYKMEGKGLQSHSNGSINESTKGQQNLINHHDIHESQVMKENGNFQLTLTTDPSKPVVQPQGMNSLSATPNHSDHAGLQTNPPQLEGPSQTAAQSFRGPLTKEAREDASFRHTNGTTTQAASKVPEGNKNKIQDSVETMKVEKENKHGRDHNNNTNVTTKLQAKLSDKEQKGNRTTTHEHADTVKIGQQENKINVTNQQEPAADESSLNISSAKNSAVSLNASKGKELENANPILSNRSQLSIEKEQDKAGEQKENYFNTKMQTSSEGNILKNQLDDSNIKNQFHDQGQLTSQDFVQIQSRPQLKIILKAPEKFTNSLKRGSDAKGHIVQILKSLIDRPLKLGSKNKDVVSMLSNLVKKSAAQKRMRQKQPQDESEAIKDSGSIAESILEANKEYLDAAAMQGMVFSDGDPDTENMTNIIKTVQGEDYQLQKPEAPPQSTAPDAEGKGASSEPHKQSPDKSISQADWLNHEHLITQIRDSGERSDSTSGMEEKDSASGRPDKDSGSGGLGDIHKDRDYSASSVAEVNAYRGGILKTKPDPKLKSFCIGKSSGIYTDPVDQRSFVICSNGVTEERECPETMLFNPKEKMCDIPDKKEKKQGVYSGNLKGKRSSS